MKTKIDKFTAAAAAKLKSQAGDTFIEVLAAGLIIVLGIAMAVTMIATASRLVTNSNKIQNEYYEQRNQVESMDIDNLDEATVSINVSLQFEEVTPKTIPIKVYTFKSSGTPVLSYFVKYGE